MPAGPKNYHLEVVTLFEAEGLTPEQIATDRGYDVEFVITTLMQFSRVYKENMRSIEKNKADVTDEEYEELLTSYKNLAKYSDDEHLREKALRFLINEKKGRNNVQVNPEAKSVVNQILVFNQALEAARQALKPTEKVVKELSSPT
jgi:hypothetical protein